MDEEEEEFKNSFNEIITKAHSRLVKEIFKHFEEWHFDAAYFDIDVQTVLKIDRETFSRRTEEKGMDRG